MYKDFIKLTLSCILFFNLSPSSADTAAIIGDCNKVLQNIRVGDNSTVIFESDCFADDPKKSYRIRYFWLDSLSLSFLMSGYTDENMKKILGKSPKLLKSGIYNKITEILNIFGVRPSEKSFFYKPGNSGYTSVVIGTKGLAEDTENTFEDIPRKIRKKLRLYNAEEKIIWPDIDAYREFNNTKKWPSKYYLTYGYYDLFSSRKFLNKLRKRKNGTDAFLCTHVYGFISKSEFQTYWNTVDTLQTIEEKENKPISDPLLNVYIGNTGILDIDYNSSYSAIEYFTKNNWPRDFLVKYGSFQEGSIHWCESNGGFGILAIPRSLFVLVGVIEATGRSLKLQGADFLIDNNTHLRLRNKLATTKKHKLKINIPALKRSDTLVIPLRIELRYDINSGFFSLIGDNLISRHIYKAIQKLPGDTYTYKLDYHPIIKYIKRKNSFKPPQFAKINNAYVFGEAWDIKSVTINNKKYKVRKTPRYAILSEAGFPAGSCPFVYIHEENDTVSFHGRVLVGANTSKKKMVDKIPLPASAKSIIILEKEPEISFIDKIVFVDGVSRKETLLLKNVVLRPREQIAINLPSNYSLSSFIKIYGYYEKLVP